MIPVVAAGAALAKYGPAVYGAFQSIFGHRKTVDWGELQSWLGKMHAEGHISPQDTAAADLTQSRLNESADASGRMATEDAQTRMRQRGLDTAPIAEATLGRIAEATARGRQAAGDTAATRLYDTWLGNKQFEQAKIMALAQGRIGAAAGDAYGANAERAGTLNSLLQYIPSLIPKSGGTPISPPSPGSAVPPPVPTPSDVPDLPLTGSNATGATPNAATRIANTQTRQSRKYKFDPATGRLGAGARPAYAGAGSGAQSGGGWQSF